MNRTFSFIVKTKYFVCCLKKKNPTTFNVLFSFSVVIKKKKRFFHQTVNICFVTLQLSGSLNYFERKYQNK